MLRAAEYKDEHAAPYKTTLLYLPCMLGISRKDDKAEVSWVKQDTTSLHYVFLFMKAPAFIHPQGRACNHFYNFFLDFNTTPSYTYHTYSYTHIYLYN